MTFFTKANGLRALLGGVCMLLLVNILLNYIDFKSENVSSFSRLSIRKTLIRDTDAFVSNSTVISVNASRPSSSITSSKDFIEIWPSNFNATKQNVELAKGVKFQGNSSLASALPQCRDFVGEEGGPITPNTTLESLDVVENDLGPFLRPGGAYQPADCTPKDHVAIVVPFRDRYAHLSVFLRNIHPFLMKQRIAYRIFVIEQTNGKAFNRAALMNIGFIEALKIFPWNCFVFHDVDLLPLDDRNLYNCPRQPRHMSVAIDAFNFRLPYQKIFGGVSAMTREHFQEVNGFSNSYFGWGGEDDDMANRINHANLFISRYPINIARYMMLRHQKEKANPKRFENLVNGISKMEMDGINSIKYDIYSVKEFPTFTWYLAELKISDHNHNDHQNHNDHH